MRQYISSAINLIVQVNRFADGTRKVVKISEITGMEGDIVLMQDLFDYVMTGPVRPEKVMGSSGLHRNQLHPCRKNAGVGLFAAQQQCAERKSEAVKNDGNPRPDLDDHYGRRAGVGPLFRPPA